MVINSMKLFESCFFIYDFIQDLVKVEKYSGDHVLQNMGNGYNETSFCSLLKIFFLSEHKLFCNC